MYTIFQNYTCGYNLLSGLLFTNDLRAGSCISGQFSQLGLTLNTHAKKTKQNIKGAHVYTCVSTLVYQAHVHNYTTSSATVYRECTSCSNHTLLLTAAAQGLLTPGGILPNCIYTRIYYCYTCSITHDLAQIVTYTCIYDIYTN